MLPLEGRAQLFFIFFPPNEQEVRQCCYISAASLWQKMKLCNRGNSLGIPTTNTPDVNTIVCFDLPDFKGGGGHPPIPGTLTINSTEEELQGLRVKESCMNTNRLATAAALWYRLQVPPKELAAEALSLHFLSTRGGTMGVFFLLPIRQH